MLYAQSGAAAYREGFVMDLMQQNTSLARQRNSLWTRADAWRWTVVSDIIVIEDGSPTVKSGNHPPDYADYADSLQSGLRSVPFFLKKIGVICVICG